MFKKREITDEKSRHNVDNNTGKIVFAIVYTDIFLSSPLSKRPKVHLVADVSLTVGTKSRVWWGGLSYLGVAFDHNESVETFRI